MEKIDGEKRGEKCLSLCVCVTTYIPVFGLSMVDHGAVAANQDFAGLAVQLQGFPRVPQAFLRMHRVGAVQFLGVFLELRNRDLQLW